jgi:hypothetical protein
MLLEPSACPWVGSALPPTHLSSASRTGHWPGASIQHMLMLGAKSGTSAAVLMGVCGPGGSAAGDMASNKMHGQACAGAH